MESIDGENNCSQRRNSPGYGSGTSQYYLLTFEKMEMNLWHLIEKMSTHGPALLKWSEFYHPISY